MKAKQREQFNVGWLERDDIRRIELAAAAVDMKRGEFAREIIIAVARMVRQADSDNE